jgi:dihydroxyacetone kinase-like protein
MGHQAINAQTLRQCLNIAATAIFAAESRLNALDSTIGDGDHGITMRLGFEAVKRSLSALVESARIDEVLKEAGSAFMGATGGAIGPLLGGMFIASGNALSGRTEIGPAEFKLMLQTMEASVSRMGKAKPGDKTILDAVHASCEAVAGDKNQAIGEVCAEAAAAAAEAAQMTANMRSAKGRSSRLGERALGHPDPGAVSFSLILDAFANCLGDTASH